METSFSELRTRIVINLTDGKRLGNVIDMIFEECTAKILGIIVPGNRGFPSMFRAKEDLFIPYHNICKIGQDTILVDLTLNRPMPQSLSAPNQTVQPQSISVKNNHTANFVEPDFREM